MLCSCSRLVADPGPDPSIELSVPELAELGPAMPSPGNKSSVAEGGKAKVVVAEVDVAGNAAAALAVTAVVGLVETAVTGGEVIVVTLLVEAV